MALGCFWDVRRPGRKNVIAKSLKEWWAGTGLNRRHQDFQVLVWSGLSATIGHHWQGFQALAHLPPQNRSRWHPIAPDGSDTTLTQQTPCWIAEPPAAS
jgi:hypothetical protein